MPIEVRTFRSPSVRKRLLGGRNAAAAIACATGVVLLMLAATMAVSQERAEAQQFAPHLAKLLSATDRLR